MLDVYVDPCTINCRKVLAGLELIGTEYQTKYINFFTGEQKSPEYMKINPNATIPAAVDGECVITESNAILQYAAESANSPAYPKELKQRASVNRWLLWEASVWFPSCYVYLVEYVVKPLMKSSPDEKAIAAEQERFHKLAGILDTQLGKTKFLAGNEATIADIAVAAPMHLHKAQKLPLEKYPNLKRWIGDVEKIPAWKKTQGAVDKALLPDTNSSNGVQKPNQVKATFNYSKETDKPTEIYFYEHELSDLAHAPGDDPHEVVITDGWDKVDSFHVDKEGFSLHEFKTDYEQWEDDEGVRKNFYPEVVEFLKKNTGAKRVLVFDHTIRTATNAAKKISDEQNTSQRAPVMLVHCDYTEKSGPLRVRQLLPDEAPTLLKSRVAFFNIWKPIHHTVEERPLAMCDVTSSPDSDFFKLHLRYRDRDGENYVMRYGEGHKWYYFPSMNTSQVILLKTYESNEDGRARFLGHTAFEDPTSKPDVRTRESVEIRCIAFF